MNMTDGTHSQPKEELPPPGWGNDKLSEFFESTRQQQFATFANLRWAFAILKEIDDCWLLAASNLNQPQDVLSALLLIRSHSAYRAACATAMATQTPESFVLLRSALEYSGYALHISKNPNLGEVWLRRHDDAESMKAVKKAFQTAAIENTVALTDAKLGDIYKTLYQSTIDYGAHPNERALSGNIRSDKDTVLSIYLHADELNIVNCLKSVALVGLTCLNLFQNIFSARFLLLGLQERIFALRTLEGNFIIWLRDWEKGNKKSASD